MNKKQVALIVVLCLGSFIAGAAMRPMNRPSVIFRRPFEPNSAPVIPGRMVHVCICGQKMACQNEDAVFHMVEDLRNELVFLGVLEAKGPKK